MIMVLDFAKSSNGILADLGNFEKHRRCRSRASKRTSEEEDSSDELQLVSFDVDGQEYAIAIEDVQEIVQVPEAIIHVPRSDSHVLGVMTLRSRLLPLVNLRSMFALPHRNLDEKSRIVVLTMAASRWASSWMRSAKCYGCQSPEWTRFPQCWLAKATLPRSLQSAVGQWKAPGVDRHARNLFGHSSSRRR